MKQKYAMNTCVFKASAANKKLEQDTHAQIADAMQATSVLYMTQLEALPQYNYVL